jgi:opacity protein-like surface antigen
MTKKSCVLLGLTLALALVMLPGAAQSKMWVGAQLGANFAANTDLDGSFAGVPFSFKSAGVDTSVIAGLTLGYDFVREGFGGYNYPDWMKYFSVATDFTFNRFNFKRQILSATIGGVPVPGGILLPQSEGNMICWSFLLIGKYGFLPDSDVPFGRLQPYLAVGPGIMFSTQNDFGFGAGSSNSVDIALVVESGIRYMALKNVSLDAAFRYRFCEPSYDFGLVGGKTDVGLTAHQFSALFRVSYHF